MLMKRAGIASLRAEAGWATQASEPWTAVQAMQGRLQRCLFNPAMVLRFSDSMPDAASPGHDLHEVTFKLCSGTEVWSRWRSDN